jgi:3-hydroxymyristoyl/3-hydroxydecanoyl-(acyl carrier protein) dehydratase
MKRPLQDKTRPLDHGVLLTLPIEEDLVYLTGHFPNSPIMPGVVLLAWAEEYGRQHLDIGGTFAGVDNLKFHQVLRPGTSVDLALRYDPLKSKLYFTYSNPGVVYASGGILFSQ